MTRLVPLVLCLALFVAAPACTHVRTNVSPVADVANAAGLIEDSAHVILVAAQQANVTIQPNGSPLLKRSDLDRVAMAVNKIGRLGVDLKVDLDTYNAAKAAGQDLTAQKAAVQQALMALGASLADVQVVIPAGTLATVDDAAQKILSIIAQLKGATL